MGVGPASIGNWESNEVQPMVHCLPGIIAFLGHNPLPEAGDLIGKLKRLRGTLGLSQEQLAQKLGIDESTVAGWERGDNMPVGSYRKLLEDFITGDGRLSVRPGTVSAKSRFSARKITALREKLGLTKAALARQIGVNVNTLWRWERGDRKPHGLHRKLFADLMGNSSNLPGRGPLSIPVSWHILGGLNATAVVAASAGGVSGVAKTTLGPAHVGPRILLRDGGRG